MYFIAYGSIVAALAFLSAVFLSSATVSVTERLARGITSAIFGFLVFGYIGWQFMPTLAWNFSGNWLVAIGIGLLMAIAARKNDRSGNSTIGVVTLIPFLAGVVFLGALFFTTCACFHHEDYRALLGTPVESEFDADLSPVDVKKYRQIDQAMATKLGSKPIEDVPGLNSRVDLGTQNIQMLDGCFEIRSGTNDETKLCFENELVWVGPLVHDDVFRYWNNGTTPGYIIISATDSNKRAMVTALKTEGTWQEIGLRYLMQGGYFGGYLERHLRTHGYTDVGLTDYSFEIDNHGRPFWVVTTYDNTIGFSGANATGVLVVDAQSGIITPHTISEAPAWIDRIQPEDMVSTQITDWGLYVRGWWQSTLVGAKQDIVKPTPGMSLVYGSDNRSYWYTGIQSRGASESNNSFMLVDTRTKEARRYMISGANETAARQAAETHPDAKKGQLTASNPVLYNVGGNPTYFIPLKGTDGVAKAFAFVSMKNQQVLGVQESVRGAMRAYQNALIQSERHTGLTGPAAGERLNGVVADTAQVGETFYLMLDGAPNVEFYGTGDVSPELKWVRAGHAVTMTVRRGADANAAQIVNLNDHTVELESTESTE